MPPNNPIDPLSLARTPTLPGRRPPSTTNPPPTTFDAIIARHAADDLAAGVRRTLTLHPPSSSSGMCFAQDLFCRRCSFNKHHHTQLNRGQELMPTRAVHCITPVGLRRQLSDASGIPRPISVTQDPECPVCGGPIEEDLRPQRWVDECDECRDGPSSLHRSATRAKRGLQRAVTTRGRRAESGAGVSNKYVRNGNYVVGNNYGEGNDSGWDVLVSTTPGAGPGGEKGPRPVGAMSVGVRAGEGGSSGLVRRGLGRIRHVLGFGSGGGGGGGGGGGKVEKMERVVELERKPTRSRNRVW